MSIPRSPSLSQLRLAVAKMSNPDQEKMNNPDQPTASQQPAPAPVREWEFCGKCILNFDDWQAFHDHKVKSPAHITCETCSRDYQTSQALKSHRLQDHAHEQNLKCRYCHKRFSRMGALVSHLELEGCPMAAKDKSEFLEGIREKTIKYSNYSEVRNFREYGRTAGDFSLEPMPTFTDYSILDPPPAMEAKASTPALLLDTQPSSVVQVTQYPVLNEEEDLMSFDDPSPSYILNADWDVLNPAVPTPKLASTTIVDIIEEFPSLTFQSPATLGVQDENRRPDAIDEIWGAKPWTSQIPPGVVESTSTVPQPLEAFPIAERPLDGSVTPQISKLSPTHPEFNAADHYHRILKKFTCPHAGCRKTMERKSAFIQHLISLAHRQDQKLQCHNCLRYFASATALTQHSESQAVRCVVRETDQYDTEVDRITNGKISTAGKHQDDTVRYVSTWGESAMGIAEAHRAAGAAKDAQRNIYWESHKPKW